MPVCLSLIPPKMECQLPLSKKRLYFLFSSPSLQVVPAIFLTGTWKCIPFLRWFATLNTINSNCCKLLNFWLFWWYFWSILSSEVVLSSGVMGEWRGRMNQTDLTFDGFKWAVSVFTYKKYVWAKFGYFGGIFGTFKALRGGHWGDGWMRCYPRGWLDFWFL